MTFLDREESFKFSNHAVTRMAQRGIRKSVLDFVLKYGERVKTLRGCEKYILSRSIAKELVASGHSKKIVDSALKIQVIVDSECNVITCYHDINIRGFCFKYHSYFNKKYRYNSIVVN